MLMKIKDFAVGFVVGFYWCLLIQAMIIGYVQKNKLAQFDYRS